MGNISIWEVNSSQVTFYQLGSIESGNLHEVVINENVVVHSLLNHFSAKTFGNDDLLGIFVVVFVFLGIT